MLRRLVLTCLTTQVTSLQTGGPAAAASTRRSWIRDALSGAAALGFSGVRSSKAETQGSKKMLNLSNEDMAGFVRQDLVNGQFLTNGRLTRAIYDEKATFTDEIDTYGLDQWMKGTQKLFVGDLSHVDLVGDVKATESEVAFGFSEVLAFNIPFKPRVNLTGRVVLSRGDNGLITHYQEYWDQSVKEVLLSAKF